MASRRLIKKCVNNLTSDLLTECIVYSRFHNETELDKVNSVMGNIVKMHSDLISKINKEGNKTVDAKATKKAYKEVVKTMNEMVAAMDGLE